VGECIKRPCRSLRRWHRSSSLALWCRHCFTEDH